MAITKDSFCNHCMNTGQVWNGEEMAPCIQCDGEDHSEQFDTVVDLDYPFDADVDIPYDDLDDE